MGHRIRIQGLFFLNHTIRLKNTWGEGDLQKPVITSLYFWNLQHTTRRKSTRTRPWDFWFRLTIEGMRCTHAGTKTNFALMRKYLETIRVDATQWRLWRAQAWVCSFKKKNYFNFLHRAIIAPAKLNPPLPPHPCSSSFLFFSFCLTYALV